MHCIGHSLGAHICGFAGKELRKRKSHFIMRNEFNADLTFKLLLISLINGIWIRHDLVRGFELLQTSKGLGSSASVDYIFVSAIL